MAEGKIAVTCPCCQALLTVDSETGIVISSKSRKESYSFDDALKKEKDRKEKTDELFAKVFEDEKKRQAGLEEKFRRALESKDELDEPPPRPIDLD